MLSASNRANGTGNPQAVPAQEDQGAVEDLYSVICKSFNMAEPDLLQTLLLCGLDQGEEEYLPAWYKDIAVKNISTEGKGQII